MPEISFIVYGHPEPQGSIRAFTPKGWKRPVLTSTNAKVKPWRQEIAGTAQTALFNRVGENGFPLPRTAGVSVKLQFVFQKPASVSKKRKFPTVKPDVDKISRAVLDALTGILFVDDSQVVELWSEKRYGDAERVEITVAEIVPEVICALPLGD